jgi:16S rRNA (guanine527-N7)-methyltransferase
MRQVKGELGLSNFHVVAGRVEALKKESCNQGAGFEVIISRAFSEIGLFVKLTKHLLSDGGQWLAMKGIVPEHEFENHEFQELCFKNGGIEVGKIEALKVAGLDAERHLIFLNPSFL